MVSLLLAQGHPHASRYPLAFMWNELAFVRQRVDAKTKLDAIMMQAVLGSALSKEGGEHFKKLLGDL